MSAALRASLPAPLIDPEPMLDPETLRSWLAPIGAGGERELARAVPVYVRAKRGVSALLGLVLEWRSARAGDAPAISLASLYLAPPGAVEEAAGKARTLHLLAPEIGPDLAVLRRPAGLFLAFPNDRALRGLSAAADARRLKNRLHRLGEPYSPAGVRVSASATCVQPLRWKPGRRAVLRADLGLCDVATGRRGSAALYLRVYPGRDLARKVAQWRAAAGLPGLEAPRVTAVDVERGFLATEALHGRPMPGREAPAPWVQAELAEALRVLYAAPPSTLAGLAERSDADDLEAADRALRDLAAWVPDWSPEIRGARTLLAAAGARLDPRPMRLVHGDLTADQVLLGPDTVALLDWDEAALGDPHGDLASLAADGALRGDEAAPEALAAPAARALGALWNEERWRWQLALAHARRSLAALQQGRPGWREPARRALRETLRLCPRAGRARPRRHPGAAVPTPAAATGLGARLRLLLDPEARGRMPGVEGRPLTLAAVWPLGGGATARLEAPQLPGVPTLWLHLGEHTEPWPFPRDPALPGLAPLLAGGRYRLAGHRFARRAALRDTEVPARVLHLRPAGKAAEIYARLAALHASLGRAGVATPRLLGEADGLHGWLAEAAPGRPLDPPRAERTQWLAVGRMLARVHSAAGPGELPIAGRAAAADAARRQIALVERSGEPFGAWLARALADWVPTAPGGGPPSREALVHGDLHAGQCLLGDAPVLIDWDCAHRGDPEEDLGNLAAHLCWELERHASAPGRSRAAWRALALGYSEGGGRFDPRCVADYARLALLRLLAVHSWRDGDRVRCLDTQRWERWPQEVAEW